MNEQNLLTLTKQLIARKSLTPEDAGCQALIAKRLQEKGFEVRHLPFGCVENMWARLGSHGPFLVFAGHTDVVPVGDRSCWLSDPFVPTERAGKLFGRGIADMKGAISAFVCAVEKFLTEYPKPPIQIGFLLTSDEEGKAIDGTAKVVAQLQAEKVKIDYCLIGEPSSCSKIGDTVKIGSRGSMQGYLTILGVQGHVGFPQEADNAIHAAVALLAKLSLQKWDDGNADFPPTSLQITNIQSGTGATNQIPGRLSCDFNFRFSKESTPESLQAQVIALLKASGLKYEISWHVFGQPFISSKGVFLTKTLNTIEKIQKFSPVTSTGGGTSDGRFLAEIAEEFLELGLPYETIHAVNEGVEIAQLKQLFRLYYELLRELTYN